MSRRMQHRTTLAAAILVPAFVVLTGVVKVASEPPAFVSRAEHQRDMQQAELRRRFEQAVVMLHAKQYDNAVTALHRVLELAPRLPEAHVNMGYALVGLQQHDAAAGFFQAAIELNPRQANAYYGLALTEEARGDFEGALGAMRSYLHLSPADDPFRTRARSALWEWEEKLGRHAAAETAPAPGTAPAPARQ